MLRKLILIFTLVTMTTSLSWSITSITVEPEDQQNITEWGFATQNRPDWGPSWAITNYPKSLDLLYDQMGATIVRFHIDYRVGFKDKRFRKDLRDGILTATKRGMKWYGLPWSPPVAMKTIEKPNGKVGGQVNRLKEGYEDDVAQWLVDLLVWLKSEGVPMPVGIGPQNEADFAPPGYPGCIYTAQQMQKTLIELRRRLDEVGMTEVKIIGDDAGAYADDYWPGNKADPNKGTVHMLGLLPGGAFNTNQELQNAVGILATHTYDIHNKLYTARPIVLQEFYESTKDLGKELWMTEWETRHEHTFDDWEIITETMAHFNRDLSSLGFNGWFHWHVWNGHRFHPGTNDEGKCVTKIRPGDHLIYEGLGLKGEVNSVRVRYSSNTDKMTIQFRAGGPDGELMGEQVLPKTTNRNKAFETLDIVLDDSIDTDRICISFSNPEHWREASLNWFTFDGYDQVEAENFSDKESVERWSSMIDECYALNDRVHFIYDDEVNLQKRPLYYIFKKIWNNAPANGKTSVRHVKSEGSRIKGVSKEPVKESFRQDLSAFVTDKSMTLVILNRGKKAEQVQLNGLTGDSAQFYQYTRADAEISNQEMDFTGAKAISSGSILDVTLPDESITIVITNGGR